MVAGEGPRGPTILKVLAPEHRTAAEVRAEIDWLCALHAAGVPVAEAYPSMAGRWIEVLDDDGHLAVAYRRASGHITAPHDWTPRRLESWGALMGRLHVHARGWTPPGPRRAAWDVPAYLARSADALNDDPPLAAALVRASERAGTMPSRPPAVGLIHADLHHGNLLLDGEAWTAIDFDDAVIGPYVVDLAMPLYYAIATQPGREPADTTDAFLTPFLSGFRRHAPCPEGGARALATALSVRRAELAAVLRLELEPARWTEEEARLAGALREATIADEAVVALEVLRRHVGAACGPAA